MPPKPKPEPKRLSTLMLLGISTLLPVCLVVFGVGLAGLQVLLDNENKSKLSQSQFGVLYRKVIDTNPFFSAMFVNGGMLGALFCIVKLVDHVRAKKPGTEPKQIAGKEENKKDK